MKRRIVIGVLVLSFVSTYCFAFNDRGISESVKEAFCKEFVNAGDVHWEEVGEFVKAQFTFNGQILDAYFSATGELVAVTRNILSIELPIHLSVELNKEYSAYWITDLFEMSAKGETSYYITLQFSDRELVLRSEYGGNWEVFKSKRETAIN